MTVDTRFPALALVAAAHALVPVATALAQEAPAPPEAGPLQPSASAESSAMPGPMEVEEQVETAKAHFAVGKSLYDSGRFQEAAAEWEKALEISGKPELSYNLYVAYRDASDLPRAIGALERYLQSDVEPQLRINLQARLDAMRRTVESRAQAQAPPAGEPPQAEPAPEPAPPPPPPAPVAQGSDQDSVAPYVVMGVGGAMVVAGIVTGILAGSAVDDIEAACPMDRCTTDYDLDAERDSAAVLVAVTDVLLIGGLVATGIGAVLALVAEKDSSVAPPTRAEPTAALACGPRGCAVRVGGRF